MTIATLTPSYLNGCDQFAIDSFPCRRRGKADRLLTELRRMEKEYNALHPDHPMTGGWPRGSFLVSSLVFASMAVGMGLFGQHLDAPAKVFASAVVIRAIVGTIGSGLAALVGDQFYRLSALKKMKKRYRQIERRHRKLLNQLANL